MLDGISYGTVSLSRDMRRHQRQKGQNGMVIHRLGLLWVLVLVLTSCGTHFENAPAGPTVEPEPYLGEWLPAEGSGGTDRLLVESGPGGTPVATFTDVGTGESITNTLRIVGVSGETIVSVPGEIEGWAHFKVERVTDTLRVAGPDFGKIRSDVEAGILPGEVVTNTYEPYEDLVIVTASDTGLRDYLASNPGAFSSPPEFVLHLAEVPQALSESPFPIRQRWRILGLVALGILALASLAGLSRRSRG